MKRSVKAMLAAVLVLALFPLPAFSEGETGYYTVYDDAGRLLFRWEGEVYPGDRYLSGDNLRYEIVSVNEQTRRASAACRGEQAMPDIFEAAQTFASRRKGEENRRIAIYFTHTDESYEPTDGTDSIKTGGSIVSVGQAFAQALRDEGMQVTVDDTNHAPHDAGAYRRSRRAAADLLESVAPAAIFDVHRDGVPPDEYLTEFDGKPASRVRIVIGAGNQNADANEELALRIKAVADKAAPGLIKDIYTGKGAYNQDLAPNAILLEFGTYSHKEERAEVAAQYLAPVISAALFGGTVPDKSAGETASPKESDSPDRSPSPSAAPQASPKVAVKGAGETGRDGRGWLWLLLVPALAVAVWILVTSEKGFGAALKDGFRELFGGAAGRRRK